MSEANDAAPGWAPEGAQQTLVVVGNGMTSHRLCQKLVDCGAVRAGLHVVVLGEEPRPAYDRVHLTDLLSGRSAESLELAPARWYEENGIELLVGDPVVEIDREECLVRTAAGAERLYDRLVFATGSRPFVPPIPGASLPGVLVYRTVEDLERILEYARTSSRAAVVGGGLLGLEAGKAALDLGLEVHVIEASAGLMARQLDERGAALLRQKIEAIGVRVHTQKRTSRIEAQHGSRLIHFEDGGCLEVDMVLIAAGIRPRSELAEQCGLAIAPGGGILIDDHLRTSDDRVFAIGECAAHRGTVYGLVVPGYRMVDVLVDNLVGGDARFEGADMSARLKLMGVTVAAIGDHDERRVPGATTAAFHANGAYRKLVMKDGRIVGAVTVGEWDNLDRLREAALSSRHISYWDMRRFRSTGDLWERSASAPVWEWPDDAIVCGCLRVTRGALASAEAEGCLAVEELSARTGAGTMCGSCKPLLAELLSRSRVDSLPPSSLAARPPPSSAAPGTLRSPLPACPAPSSRTLRAPRRESIRPTIQPVDAPSMFCAEEADGGPLSRRGSSMSLPARRRRTTLPPEPPIPVPASARAEGAAPEIASIIPPPSSSPVSIRDLLPPSVRDAASILMRDSAARLMQDASLAAALAPTIELPPASSRRPVAPPACEAPPPSSADPPTRRPADPTPPSPPRERPPESPPRDSPPSSIAPPSSPPPSSVPASRRASLPPLRPVSVAPGPASGRISAPPSRASVAAAMDAEHHAARRVLAASIATAAIAAILAFLGPAPIATSAAGRLHLEDLWTGRAGKLATGSVVVACALLGSVLSLAKRTRLLRSGDVAAWRAIHAALGALGLAALAAHTGLGLGHNLNRALMIDFLALSLLGAIAGGVTALAHWMSPKAARDQRLLWSRAHLLLFLPLPVLLAAHVLAAFFYG